MKTGRNDPCVCGSGKKYKNCCLSSAGKLPFDGHLKLQATVEDAIAHHQAGRWNQAEQLYRQLLEKDPQDPNLLHLMGLIFLHRREYSPAIANIRRALEYWPDESIFISNLGAALHASGELREAEKCYRKLLEFKADFAEAYNNLGTVLQDQGSVDEAIDCFRRAVSLNPNYWDARSNLLLAMQYSSYYSSREIFNEHLRFGCDLESSVESKEWSADRYNGLNEKLRIGYVSADFNNHSVASFIEPVLKGHDKDRFDVYCYYNNFIVDEVTLRFMSMVKNWVPCKGMADVELASRIQADRIDILVDLSGHTSGNRLPVFARKPAPMQVTWIGYPGTTGLKSIDFRITDACVDPEYFNEVQNSEFLLRLPPVPLYQPPNIDILPNELPALKSGIFTFACLNRVVKISQKAVELFAAILSSIPKSRLILGYIDDKEIEFALAEKFRQHGVSQDRIIFKEKLSFQEYLHLHHEIDLALDSFPYNGGTTTWHSIWMGVPVLSLLGDRPCSRSGLSIQNIMGLSEFVIDNETNFLAAAVSFSNNLTKLSSIRARLALREGFRGGAHQVSIVGDFEKAIVSAWEARRKQHSGASIYSSK